MEPSVLYFHQLRRRAEPRCCCGYVKFTTLEVRQENHLIVFLISSYALKSSAAELYEGKHLVKLTLITALCMFRRGVTLRYVTLAALFNVRQTKTTRAKTTAVSLTQMCHVRAHFARRPAFPVSRGGKGKMPPGANKYQVFPPF